ncbi:MAG: membrane protein insertase YidC [Chitinophagaceae bacterium]|nr:MAG: membrane protein insertase YidC [Chitinophagaceae bacterium]
MNFDRNTIIGFVCLALLFLGMFFYTSREQKAYQEQKRVQDSIAAAKRPRLDPMQVRLDSLRADSMARVAAAAGLDTNARGAEQTLVIENSVLRISFSSRGGQPKLVELKKFKSFDSSLVRLGGQPGDHLHYRLAGTGINANSSDLNFTPGAITTGADGSQQVSFQLNTPAGPVVHQYIIPKDDYLIDFNLQVPQAYAQNGNLSMEWVDQAVQVQKDITYERQQAAIAYREDGDFDDYNVFKEGPRKLDKPVNWIAVKQQFFNSALIARNNFSSANLAWTPPPSEETAGNKYIVQSTATVQLPLKDGKAPLALYYGPNDYKLLKRYNLEMENMVNLGSGMFAFVKYLNRWVVLPVFDIFSKMTTNMGIAILLLTLFIRLLISPLTYKSYVSSAKMKALKPELDKLKEKHGGDQQAMGVAQMALYREAGVSMFGGCLPALVQMPIFIALYNFFNSNIAVRGKSFLWAEDLSRYDTILNFGFHIPMLGDHLSLFTLTAVITSLLISLYSMSMTPTQDNPMMKYMPYIFPVVMLFFFNKLPSALTWYYTVSNIITLVLQFVIQQYIIDHNKILAQIEENRRRPKKKAGGGWAEKMAQMQEQQKRIQEERDSKKKK